MIVAIDAGELRGTPALRETGLNYHDPECLARAWRESWRSGVSILDLPDAPWGSQELTAAVRALQVDRQEAERPPPLLRRTGELETGMRWTVFRVWSTIDASILMRSYSSLSDILATLTQLDVPEGVDEYVFRTPHPAMIHRTILDEIGARLDPGRFCWIVAPDDHLRASCLSEVSHTSTPWRVVGS